MTEGAMTGYPIILNGDHAEFEARWAGKDSKSRPDWPLPSFDARDWAEAFRKQYPAIAEDIMVGWFANALMRGFDERSARASPRERVASRADADEAEATIQAVRKQNPAALGEP